MLAYISRRLFQTVIALIGVTLLLFLVLNTIPGDPARLIAGKNATPKNLARIRHELALDKPLYIRYFYYLTHLARGDFGKSYYNDQSVLDIVKEKYPRTVRLALGAIIIEIVIGLFAGIVAAARRRSFWDTLVTLSTTFLVCIPVFWLGMVLIYIFVLKLRIIPGIGYGDGALEYLVLPCFVLASASMAYVARLMRTSMLEVMNKDYIRAARAKGLPERVIIYKHALKNALFPVVTFIGFDFGALLGGAVATEAVFNIQGVGYEIYNSILMRDNEAVIGITLILVLIFVFVNLAVDISYAYLDPRIRY